jgi:hypothetical protein
MNRPDRLYHLAANCYQCHLIADEQVVNVGGHPVSVEFELVSWSQGAMRHNFRRDEQAGNAHCSAERKRVMYVLGHALQLEHALRAIAGASAPGPYLRIMLGHAEKAIAQLERIALVADIPEVQQMLACARSVSLVPEDGSALIHAADKVGQTARRFETNHNGAALEALDALVPAPESYKGLPPGKSGTRRNLDWLR